MFTYFTAKHRVCARFLFGTDTIPPPHPRHKLAIKEGNIAWRKNILFNSITNEGSLSFNIISEYSPGPGALRIACQKVNSGGNAGEEGHGRKNKELQEVVG